MPTTVTITGDKEIDEKLKVLSRRAARRVAIAAVRSGLVEIKREMKADIPHDGARKAIGSRFAKAKRGDAKGTMVGKVGAAVARKKSQQEADAAARKGKSKSGGVGLSSRNIHWWLLGTKDRVQKDTGRKTGRMPKAPGEPIKEAFERAQGRAMDKVRERIEEGIRREVLKLAKSKSRSSGT